MMGKVYNWFNNLKYYNRLSILLGIMFVALLGPVFAWMWLQFVIYYVPVISLGSLIVLSALYIHYDLRAESEAARKK